MSVPALQVAGISKTFGGQHALEQVDLVIDRAAFVGLIGPNGAGKTTLFDVICGLLEPSEGEVRLRGSSLGGVSAAARARRGLARTFQRSELFLELTAREHLVLAHRARNSHARAGSRRWWRHRSDPNEAAAVHRLVAGLGLGPFADRPVVELPLGARRLVEVARALAAEPTVVLLDEPSAGLDRHETERLADALSLARREHQVAFLLVEHDVDFVLGLSDQVYVLDDGRVIAQGPPAAVRHDPAVRTAYLGQESAT